MPCASGEGIFAGHFSPTESFGSYFAMQPQTLRIGTCSPELGQVRAGATLTDTDSG